MVLPVHEAEEHSSHRAILTWLYATPSPSSQGNWRSGLAERPSNIMSQRSESPSKKRRRAREDHGASDPEITPRSPRFAINLPPPPPPPRSPSRSSASTQSNRSQRSASPAKRMMDLLLRPHPTISVQFGTPDVAMPEALQAMLSMVKQFARGLGVVSESCLDDVTSVGNESFWDVDHYAFTQDPVRDHYGPSPPSHAVRKILMLARQCEVDEHSEASWNGRVHTAMLDLSLYNDVYQGKVDFLNCTTATIQPKSLVNAGHSGKPGESKMVDFAIYLEPDQAMLEAMRSLAARKPYDVTSVNHTWHAPLITRPISVNIETKRSGEGWSAAAMQLGIWVGAQFSKLEQLVNDIGQGIQMIPFLPLIVVQGHDWYFLAASQGENGQTYLWSKVCFGSTSTALGIYQITATIQSIAYWTQTVYRPWFLESALGMQST